MRTLAPAALLATLLFAASAASALSLVAAPTEADDVEVAPDRAPARSDAAVAGQGVGYLPDKRVPADATVHAAAPHAEAGTREAPVAAGPATVALGEGGRLATDDASTLAATAALEAAAVTLGLEADASRAIRDATATAQGEAEEAVHVAGGAIDAARDRIAHHAERIERELARALVPEPTPGAPAPQDPPAQAQLAAPQTPPAPEGGDVVALIVAAAAIGALLLIPLALYHRLHGARLLQQRTRRAIVSALREHPGATNAALAMNLDLDAATVRYHLERLEKNHLVIPEGPARRRRWFAAGHHATQERAALVAAALAPQVLAAVRAAPGITKTQLANRLAIARGTLAWHLRRLERADAIVCRREGRLVRVHPVE